MLFSIITRLNLTKLLVFKRHTSFKQAVSDFSVVIDLTFSFFVISAPAIATQAFVVIGVAGVCLALLMEILMIVSNTFKLSRAVHILTLVFVLVGCKCFQPFSAVDSYTSSFR